MLVLGNSPLTRRTPSGVPTHTTLGGIPPGRGRPRWRAIAYGGAAAALVPLWIGGTAQAAAPVNPGPSPLPLHQAALSTSVDCDETLVEVDGAVDCTADTSDAAPNAVLVYTWTYDGQQQAENGAELSLSNVTVGNHTVTVVVRDSANGITSAPQSTTFENTGNLAPNPEVLFD